MAFDKNRWFQDRHAERRPKRRIRKGQSSCCGCKGCRKRNYNSQNDKTLLIKGSYPLFLQMFYYEDTALEKWKTKARILKKLKIRKAKRGGVRARLKEPDLGARGYT